MSTQMKIAYAWVALGIIFAIAGLMNIASGNMGGFLTLAVAALIMYTSVHQIGGWEAMKWDIKKRLRLFGKK